MPCGVNSGRKIIVLHICFLYRVNDWFVTMLRRSVTNLAQSGLHMLLSPHHASGRAQLSRMSTIKIQMPKLMSAKNGTLDKWIKNEGEAFSKGEALAELTLDGITIGLQLKESGVLVKQILKEGESADIGENIALVVEDQASYARYLHEKQLKAEEAAALRAAEEARARYHDNSINILRHIKHLIQLDILEDESDFVVALLELAQNEDHHLMDLFESSYDGEIYNEASFDNSFFIENVKIMLQKKQDHADAESAAPSTAKSTLAGFRTHEN